MIRGGKLLSVFMVLLLSVLSRPAAGQVTDPVSIPVNSPSWFYESEQSAAELGHAVSSAGDINDDGYDDVIVGSPKYTEAIYKGGAAFVFYGSAGGLNTVPDWTAGGDQTGANFGQVATGAGDINRDGYADIVVSAPRYNNGGPRAGRVFVFYGSAQGLSQTAAWVGDGELAEAHFGWSVSGAGDVNGDQYADLIIGAKWHAENFVNEGKAYLYLGGADGLADTPIWTAVGAQAGASLGSAVAGAGDINGDGFADIMVAAPLFDGNDSDCGLVAVYCGSTQGPGETPCWQAAGQKADHLFGEAVSGAGDVDGDGYLDILIGAPALTEPGAVYLYRGTATGLSLQPAWTAVSAQLYSNFGKTVTAGGDINDDGYADFLIGAPQYTHDQAKEGRIVVYYGRPTGPGSWPDWLAEGNKAEAEFGLALGGGGDVNGDSLDDVLVGAPNYRHETELRGRVYLFDNSPAAVATGSVFLPLILTPERSFHPLDGS